MKNTTTKVVVATSLAAGGAAVGTNVAESAPPKVKHFEFKAHGLKVQRPGGGASTKVKTHADGRVRIDESTSISVKGMGAHAMTAVVEDEPIARGGRQKTTITDGPSGATTVFSYTPANNSITIAHGGGQTVVVQNPDHTYTVDGKPAANGKAAVALMRKNPAYRAVGPHAALLAYSYAHAPNAAARNTQNCDLPECMEEGIRAAPPAVCTAFNDLCECVACDKTGKGNNCATCK